MQTLINPFLILASPATPNNPPRLLIILKNCGDSYFYLESELTEESFDLLDKSELIQESEFFRSLKQNYKIQKGKGNAKTAITLKLKSGFKSYGTIDNGSAFLRLYNANEEMQLFSRAELEPLYLAGYDRVRFTQHCITPRITPLGTVPTILWA